VKWLIVLAGACVATASFAQSDNSVNRNRFAIVSTSQGVFLLDQQDGCMWKRDVFENMTGWFPERRLGPDGPCTDSLKDFLELNKLLSQGGKRQ
jgi:hypothetical protein